MRSSSIALFAFHCLQIAVEWLRQGALVVAAACVILLCFAAESCKSQCSGGVRVANAALAAKFFNFGSIQFIFPLKL